MKKMTAWEHIKVAHDHLLVAYSQIDVTQFYADTLNRALRNAALSMGQMPTTLSKRPAKKTKVGRRTSHNRPSAK